MRSRTLNLQCVWNCHFLLFFANHFGKTILCFNARPTQTYKPFRYEFFQAFCGYGFVNCPRRVFAVPVSHTRALSHSQRETNARHDGSKKQNQIKPGEEPKKKSFICHAMELNFVVVIIKTDHVHGGFVIFRQLHNFQNENFSHFHHSHKPFRALSISFFHSMGAQNISWVVWIFGVIANAFGFLLSFWVFVCSFSFPHLWMYSNWCWSTSWFRFALQPDSAAFPFSLIPGSWCGLFIFSQIKCTNVVVEKPNWIRRSYLDIIIFQRLFAVCNFVYMSV